MSRPLEIADGIDTLANELMGIDAKYTEPVETIHIATTEVRALTPPDVRRWQDPRSWPSGRVPTRNEDVVVDSDILIDGHAECRRLDILAGTATLDADATLEHFSGSTVVHNGAGFKATTGTILYHVPDDRLFLGNGTPGPNPDDPDDHSDTDFGLWGLMHSTVILAGPEVTPWLRVLPKTTPVPVDMGYGVMGHSAISFGDAMLESAPIGWEVGDTLLLDSLNGSPLVVTLESLVGQTVTFEGQGAGDYVAMAFTRAGEWAYPRIANLSRRLRVISADVVEGDFNHRAHIALMHHGHYHVRNVEARNLGPRGKLGRYSIHFHAAGEVEHGGGVEGCSIWQDVSQPGNRFVTMHGTKGLTCANNVGFRCRGHGFFMEDTTEEDNVVRGNLAVGTTGPEELPSLNSPVGTRSRHYWIYQGNVVDGNVASGREAEGLFVIPRGDPEVPVTISNHESSNCMRFGIWSNCPHTIIDNPRCLFNSTAGLAFWGSQEKPVKSHVVNNPILWLNGAPDTHYSPYQTQTFATVCGDVRINGGQMAGKIAVHHHYQPADHWLVGVDVECRFSQEPTYWYNCIRVEGGSRKVYRLFVAEFPPKYHGPGFSVIDDVWYVGQWFAHYPTWEGTDDLDCHRLNAPVQVSGFIPAPAGTKKWELLPIGTDSKMLREKILPTYPNGKKLIRRENLSLWQAGILTESMGYPDGFPPGQYRVAYYDGADGLILSGVVTVVSGEVASLPT